MIFDTLTYTVLVIGLVMAYTILHLARSGK